MVSEKNNKIIWIDALKGLGIFFVTIGHLNPNIFIEKHIYSFHMFLFFFISGYLFYEKDIKIAIKTKTKTLLIPFIIWNFASCFVEIICGNSLKDVISDFFIINGKLCWNSPIWFLLILFFSYQLYNLIMNINNSLKMSFITLIISTIIFFLIGSSNFILKLNLIPLAILGIALGDIYKNISKDKEKNNLKIILTLILLGMINIIFGVILNIRISYTFGNFGNKYYCILASASGILFYVILFKELIQLFSNKIFYKLLCLMGRNSMIIMLTQYFFFELYDKISYKLYNISVWHYRGTIKASIISIITITIIIAIVDILKNIFKNKNEILKLAKYIGIR